MDFILS